MVEALSITAITPEEAAAALPVIKAATDALSTMRTIETQMQKLRDRDFHGDARAAFHGSKPYGELVVQRRSLAMDWGAVVCGKGLVIVQAPIDGKKAIVEAYCTDEKIRRWAEGDTDYDVQPRVAVMR